MNESTVIAVIPARFASSRLPGKLLKEICGKSILKRVYEQCTQSKLIRKVVIVTDHDLIFKHANSFGAEVFESQKQHVSGTDRIAEYVEYLSGYSHVINIQGDEPFIDPCNIDILVKLLLETNCDIASLAIQMNDFKLIQNPNIVKLVTDNNGNALYFSRAEIPFLRDQHATIDFHWKKHIGIYGFKKEALLQLTQLQPSSLELIESLEQLRWLQYGYQIQIGMVDHHANGVDTEEDLMEAIQFASVNNL